MRWRERYYLSLQLKHMIFHKSACISFIRWLPCKFPAFLAHLFWVHLNINLCFQNEKWSQSLSRDTVNIKWSKDYYKKELIFTNVKTRKSGQNHAEVLAELKKRCKSRNENMSLLYHILYQNLKSLLQNVTCSFLWPPKLPLRWNNSKMTRVTVPGSISCFKWSKCAEARTDCRAITIKRGHDSVNKK